MKMQGQEIKVEYATGMSNSIYLTIQVEEETFAIRLILDIPSELQDPFYNDCQKIYLGAVEAMRKLFESKKVCS